MQSGENLEIILDGGGPIRDVPRAIKEEGHKIVKVDRESDDTDGVIVLVIG